jgi:chemosensory pili system protein ChpA (sensor histidine kinase/response regulator)
LPEWNKLALVPVRRRAYAVAMRKTQRLASRTSRKTVSKETFRVLHAEDSDDCAALVRRALRRGGFHQAPFLVRDGADAIHHLSSSAPEALPDAILLDLHMPSKNGFEVLDWVRHHPLCHSIPVVMLTSSDEATDIARAKVLGATRYLNKDGTFQKVIETLEHLVASSLSARDEAPE